MTLNGLDLVAPEVRADVLEKINSGYELPYDSVGIRKDGTRYNLEIHGKKVPYKGTQVRVTEFRDITSRKLAEEKSIEQNYKLSSIAADLKRKNEQLEEFTQIVSHNLRSPVSNILTLLDFHEKSSDSDEKNHYLNLIHESAHKMLENMHELNEVLKVKQNKSIEREIISFESTLRGAQQMLSAKIMEAGADIHYDFLKATEILYPNIYLESIFINLLSNAIKYRHPERRPEISFKSYPEKGEIVLEVSDNGIGINLNRYGHQIFKLRKTFHKHPESRGIGLFMIKNQIEAMSGDITVSSEENIGTTFVVRFGTTNNVQREPPSYDRNC